MQEGMATKAEASGLEGQYSRGGGLSLMSLVIPRWIAIAGQTAAIVVVKFGLEYDFPFLMCLAVIALSANLNLFLTFRSPNNRRLSEREATAYLAFDVLQLTLLLHMTGGLQNPFFILFLAPVTISASSLSLRSTILLVLLALLCVSFVSLFYRPFPWISGELFSLPLLYQIGLWTAICLSLIFSAIYSWRVAQEARRMSDALAALQYVLGREQRLSAVGGLAAAAAHELGTKPSARMFSSC
jgi:two-component system sensor histidine kinase RegB